MNKKHGKSRTAVTLRRGTSLLQMSLLEADDSALVGECNRVQVRISLSYSSEICRCAGSQTSERVDVQRGDA